MWQSQVHTDIVVERYSDTSKSSRYVAHLAAIISGRFLASSTALRCCVSHAFDPKLMRVHDACVSRLGCAFGLPPGQGASRLADAQANHAMQQQTGVNVRSAERACSSWVLSSAPLQLQHFASKVSKCIVDSVQRESFCQA